MKAKCGVGCEISNKRERTGESDVCTRQNTVPKLTANISKVASKKVVGNRNEQALEFFKLNKLFQKYKNVCREQKK